MAKQFTLSIFLILVTCLTAGATETDVSGTWEADVMGSQIVVQVSQSDTAISGVAHITTSAGGEGSYRFAGSINGSTVSAALAGGHSFSGKLYSEGKVTGMLRTKDGRRIPISASRRSGGLW